MSDEEVEEYGGGGAEEELDDIDEVRMRLQLPLDLVFLLPMMRASSPC